MAGRVVTLQEERHYKSGPLLEAADQNSPRATYKWTVLITMNDGFWDFFLNWYFYYQRLQLNWLVIVMAEDDMIFQKISTLNLPHFEVIRTKLNLQQSLDFGTADYKAMVSMRATYILRLLCKDTNVLYSDVDTVWLKDPSQYFTGHHDTWIQVDGSGGQEFVPYYCTGFMAIVANNRTRTVMQDWESALLANAQANQPVFNRILHASKVNHTLLPERSFPNGKRFFEQFSREQQQAVVIVHNNWINGVGKKRKRFGTLGLWHPDLPN
jgi:hypothetical protein